MSTYYLVFVVLGLMVITSVSEVNEAGSVDVLYSIS